MDGWRRVERKGRRRVSPLSRWPETEDGEPVSFFIRNFPEQCTAEELCRRFERLGNVREVFLPGKRDKRGKRFGFVRFERGVEGERLLEELNKVWIDSYLIRAFWPKFERRETNVNNVKLGRRPENKDEGRIVTLTGSDPSMRKAGVSFSEALKGTASNSVKPKDNIEKGVEETDEILFQSSEKERSWLEGAYVGCHKSEFQWRDHEEEMRNECSGQLRLTEMGGGFILIQTTTENCTEKGVRGLNEWTDFWFEWCRPWEFTDVNRRRLVWTRWIGVPLHAWSSSFFGIGCARFGRLEEVHEVTKSRRRLDEAFILVSTGMATIDHILKCRVDGAGFQIRVEELRCMGNKDPLLHLEIDKLSQDSEEESDDDLLSEMEERESGDAIVRGGSTLEAESSESVGGGQEKDFALMTGGPMAQKTIEVDGILVGAVSNEPFLHEKEVPEERHNHEKVASEKAAGEESAREEDGLGLTTNLGPTTRDIVSSPLSDPNGGGPNSAPSLNLDLSWVEGLNKVICSEVQEPRPISEKSKQVEGSASTQTEESTQAEPAVNLSEEEGRIPETFGIEPRGELTQEEGRADEEAAIGVQLKGKTCFVSPAQIGWDVFIGGMRTEEDPPVEPTRTQKKKGKRGRGRGKEGSPQREAFIDKKGMDFGRKLGFQYKGVDLSRVISGEKTAVSGALGDHLCDK